MNWNQVKGNWHQIKGKVRTEWGKLTDDDLVAIDGKREQLLGKLQEKYGIAKEEAEKQMDGFLKKIK
ncbi:MAG: CsbD family protein [Desulfobacterales bacterium]|nr:CsbD family protein [Desulfobacterales bacterium]